MRPSIIPLTWLFNNGILFVLIHLIDREINVYVMAMQNLKTVKCNLIKITRFLDII